jgi:hypothetical protein
VTLTKGLFTFGFEAIGLAVAVGVVGWLLNSRQAIDRRLVVAAVLTVIVIGTGFRDLEASGSLLRQAHRSGAGTRAGIDHCLGEDRVGSTVAFVEWLRRHMPPESTYVLQAGAEPDPWCVALALLPRLPAFGAERPGWLVAYGSVSPELRARVASHDPTVQVFAPGLALAREPR